MKLRSLFHLGKEKSNLIIKGKSLYWLSLSSIIAVLIVFPLLFNSELKAADPHPAPILLRADTYSKQTVFLTFNEPISITGNPTSWAITQNLAGTPPTVSKATLANDRRVISVTLSAYQGQGNQPTPLKYTITVTGVQNDYAVALPQDNVANRTTWEAFSPHGKYAPWSGGTIPEDSGTTLCGQCHSAHSPSAVGLIYGNTITKGCFGCHGTTGPSIFDVQSEFSRGTPFSVSLHKTLDSDNAGYDVLECTDCHNSHGDLKNKTVSNAIYEKLLRVTDTDGTKYYSGNPVCLACHGKDNRGFENSTYYNNTGGNHINPLNPNNINSSDSSDTFSSPAHLNGQLYPSLKPTSGTNITCVKCHEKHGSQYGSLVDNTAVNSEEELCYKCHSNKNTEFNSGSVKSRHEVGSNSKGKVECSSCHGPHTLSNNTYTAGSATQLTRITDPDNTKNWFYGAGSASINSFCLKCHDDSPPVKTTTSTTIVPYTISFNDLGFTNSGLGWNKSTYSTSAYHLSAPAMRGCTRCHSSHASTLGLNLLYGNVNGEATDKRDICSSTCHWAAAPGGTSYAFWNNNTDKVDLPYVHPALSINGVHRNTENWAGRTVARHSECADCHDVHSSATGLGGEIDKNGRVTGVTINSWNSADWFNWSTTTPDWSLGGLILGSSKQYQLCLKCHSKFSYITPPITPSSSVAGYWAAPFNQTDLAMEFNPANPAGHAVIGTAKVPPAYSGKFAGGKTAATILICSDCHGYDATKKGVHGSNNRFILRMPWSDNTGKPGTSGDLCFLCHDFNFYTGADLGSVSVKSQFSVAGSVYQYNAHNSAHAAYGCIACHGPVHGWPYTDSAGNGLSLHLQSDPRPYSDGVMLTSFDVTTSNTPGNWKGHSQGANRSCDGCH